MECQCYLFLQHLKSDHTTDYAMQAHKRINSGINYSEDYQYDWRKTHTTEQTPTFDLTPQLKEPSGNDKKTKRKKKPVLLTSTDEGYNGKILKLCQLPSGSQSSMNFWTIPNVIYTTDYVICPDTSILGDHCVAPTLKMSPFCFAWNSNIPFIVVPTAEQERQKNRIMLESHRFQCAIGQAQTFRAISIYEEFYPKLAGKQRNVKGFNFRYPADIGCMVDNYNGYYLSELNDVAILLETINESRFCSSHTFFIYLTSNAFLIRSMLSDVQLQGVPNWFSDKVELSKIIIRETLSLTK